MHARYAQTGDFRQKASSAKKPAFSARWLSDDFCVIIKIHVRISVEGRDTLTDTKSQR